MVELQARKLTLSQAEEVYKEHLKMDFPPAEVKPFLVIRQAWKKKNYHAYGFYKTTGEEEVLCAYAFFLADQKDQVLLLDYFAVCRQLRGSGYGSHALALLRKECADWNVVLIEVEDDELPGLEEEVRKTRKRRIAFYAGAGCLMTTTRSRLWNVDYRIMVMPLKEGWVQENIVDKMEQIYQGMYTIPVLKKHFEITAK